MCYTGGFAERNSMPAAPAKPIRSWNEEDKRAQQILAALWGKFDSRRARTQRNEIGLKPLI
jgi:hypothetical protein